MNLKTFFGLNEGLLHEMAGMPQDNPFNSFMYKKIMDTYGHRWAGEGGAWPKGTPYDQKLDDVTKWYKEAWTQGIKPSRGIDNTTLRSVVSALDWPFRVGSGQKSKNAAINMRQLVVQIGFADAAAIKGLWEAEGEKGAEPAAPQAASAPKASKAFQVKSKAAQTLGGKEATPPTIRKGGAEEPPAPPAEEPAAEPEKKSSDSWDPGKRSGGYKPPEDDPDFQ